MDEPENTIPASFWASLSEDDWDRILANGGKFDRPLCARLYRMTDRHGTPPDEITPLLSRDDIDRWLESRGYKTGNRKARRAAKAKARLRVRASWE